MARAEFTALGGGDCIGNSCYFLKVPKRKSEDQGSPSMRLEGGLTQELSIPENDFYNIVVDCGVKFDNDDNDKLHPAWPDLSKLDGVRVDIIFLTHAHADHYNGMPALVRKHPEAMVVMTEPTGRLLELAFQDVIKVSRKYNRVPLFSEDDVEFFFADGRVKTVGPGEWETPFEDDPNFTIALWPSGHTRGAASVLMKTRAGNFMFSGDVSLHDLPTIKGAELPKEFRPDVLITEMTYGGSNQKPRDQEEDRLIQKVEEVVGRGGNVLIPAFAMGRAADVALTLARAGIQVYLAGSLALKMMRKFGESVWCDRDIPVTPHENIKFLKSYERKAVIEGHGNVVIASSGMMDFGYSSTFAKAWMEDHYNALCFSGYLAEDTFGKNVSMMRPGGKIRVQDKETGEVETITLRAEVYEFCFSAHADQTELADWMLALSPKEIVGIHCERRGYEALTRVLLERDFTGSTRLGENGKTLVVGYEV